MSDLESRLRELLQHKAGEAPAAPVEPNEAALVWAAGARLRSRRRREVLGAAGGVAAVVLALAVLVLVHRNGAGGTPVASGSPCFRAASITPAAPAASSNWTPITLAPAGQCFELTADVQGSSGVAPSTGFTLTSTVRTDAATLRPRLKVTPGVPLTVSPVGSTGQRFQIKPTTPLAATTLYRFALLDRPGGQAVQTWSFQADGPLTVAESVPGNQATNVPLNIGIQLTFSLDGVSGVQQRFSISPKVPGTFQTEDRTVSFVPSSPLQPATVYTVTVTAGVSVTGTSETLDNDVVLQFETGTGNPNASGGLTFVNPLWGSPIASAPTFSFLNFMPSRGSTQPASTTLSVYRLSGVDAFLGSLGALNTRPQWATMAPINYPSVTTTGLSEVEQVTAPLQLDKSVLETRLPAALPAGYYLVTVPTGATGGASPIAYSLLQVSDLSAYVTESTTKTLVWVNDLATGKSVAGVSVRLAGQASTLATTGPDGTASFSSSVFPSASTRSTEIAPPQELILSGPGGTQATVQVSNAADQRDFTGEPTAFGNSDAAAGYWQFLTTDRPFYRLSDTVQAWGVLRARTQLSAPQKVELIVTGGLYGGSPVTVAQTTVMTGPDGTYQGALSYQQADPGFYSVEALVGGQVISNTPIQIVDFVTPPYQLTVASSKQLVVAGDPVTFTVQASFFDGSPAANLGLSASFGAILGAPSTPYRLTTDAAGVATLVAVPPGGSDPPTEDTLVVFPTIPEQANISASTGIEVLSANLTTQLLAIRQPSSVTISGTVDSVDLAKANALGAGPDAYQGPPIAHQPVAVLVTATTTTFVRTGQSYNSLQNTTTPIYAPVFTAVTKTVHAVTDAHGAVLVTVPAPSSAAVYTAELDVADSNGRFVDKSAYASPPSPPGVASLVLAPSGPFRLDQQVQAVAIPASPVTGTAATGTPYLFTVASNGLLAHSVQASGTYGFGFSAADVPNATVDAVYFNGSTYADLGSQTATFDTGSKALDIKVEPVRGGYRPGDEATLGLQVSQGGRPVQAQVLVSVVDNAIFSLGSGLNYPSSDILGGLYSPVPSGIVATFQTPTGAAQPTAGTSALPVSSGPTLQNIRDDADFTQVATGGDGKGSVSFALPDNLTSWRVQALAVTGDLAAGAATTLVPVSLPLFVNLTLNTSYLASDAATARVAAYGTSLKEGEPVTFTVEAPGLAAAPLVQSGTAFTPVDIALPPLPPGSHNLTFRVNAGGQSEGIVKTISVAGSRLTSTSAQYSQVGAGDTWTAPAVTGVADVTVSDASRGGWYPELLGLSVAAGNRADQLLAEGGAEALLARFFGAPTAGSAPSLNAYQESSDGGVASLPFGSADEVASAAAAALNPAGMNRSDLTGYFQGLLAAKTTTAEGATIALYGLAGLGQPVLPQLQAAVASGTLDPTARLYAGLAAAELGDMELARSLYRGLVGQYGQAEGSMNRLEVDPTPDDVYQASALAAELGAYLSDSNAAGFEHFVDANPSTTSTAAAEQVLFLRQYLPQLPAGDAQVSYSLDGSAATKSLAGGSISLHIAASQLRSLNLHADKGTVAITLSEQLPVTPATAKVDPSLSLVRSYSATSVTVGTVVNITLSYHLGAGALAGCYQLTDLLPSGFKVLADPYQVGADVSTLSTPYAIQGQAVDFCAFPGTTATGSITYPALAVEPGTYRAEPATLQAQSAQQSLAFSGATTVTIK